MHQRERWQFILTEVRAPSARGAIEGDRPIARTEAKLLSCAEKLAVLVDSSKFDAPGSVVVCKLPQINTFITDYAAPPDILAQVVSGGVDAIIVRNEKFN